MDATEVILLPERRATNSDLDWDRSKSPQISPIRIVAADAYSSQDILPDALEVCRIVRRASLRARKSVGMVVQQTRFRMCAAFFALVALAGGGTPGCAGSRCDSSTQQFKPIPARQVVVVAPVLNLSNTTEFDTLKVTDAVASELVGFPGIAAVPVNLTLAALAREGKTRVESPVEATELARQFGAQATLVTAVTEYRPYDPPVIGLIMQWYAVPEATPGQNSHLARAQDFASCSGLPELSGFSDVGPRIQLQRVFNAADEEVLDEVKNFAHQRDGHSSPYGWHRYIKSQELYVRYCCWSLIRSILAVDQSEWAVSAASEAQP
jgi:hypothetical protein